MAQSSRQQAHKPRSSNGAKTWTWPGLLQKQPARKKKSTVILSEPRDGSERHQPESDDKQFGRNWSIYFPRTAERP
jgi:hypothetical protein